MIKIGQAPQQEQGGPKTGFFRATVCLFNPTQPQLSQLLGRPYPREKNYLWEGHRGERAVNVEIWLREVITGEFFVLRFSLVEKLRQSEKTGYFQWINEAGTTLYAPDKEYIEQTPDTPENWRIVHFRKWKYRQAMIGEEILMDFLQTLLLQGTLPQPGTIIAPDMRKIFKGDFSELNRDIQAVARGNEITALALISPSRTGKGKSYQAVWKTVAPGSWYERLKTKTLTPAIQYWLDTIQGPFGPVDLFDTEKFISG
jgi:hypothetical protein